MGRPKNIPEDVWKRIDKGEDKDCWNWLGGCVGGGYGQISIGDKMYLTHRLVYELIYGNIIEGLCILHNCNNPKCCNPSHLRMGTIEENNVQRDREGRRVIVFGEKCGTHKLTNIQVRKIRELYSTKNYTQTELGKRFKIDQSNISYIVRKKTWRI